MFNYFIKKIGFFKINIATDKHSFHAVNHMHDTTNSENISSNLLHNIKAIKGTMCNSSDLRVHDFCFGKEREINGALLYLSNMVDRDLLQKNVLHPIMYDSLLLSGNGSFDITDIKTIKNSILTVSETVELFKLNEIIDSIITGTVVLLIEGQGKALSIVVKKREQRSIEDPPTETSVRGPREGFNENINVNIVLLRSRIKDPNLCIETLKIGARTKTDVSLAYLKDVADSRIVDEVRMRLNKINIDSILESGYIEEFIEDAPYSIFPTVANSERPDKIAAKILEGRVAILVDGTPFVLTVPMLFVENFQSAEDYYSRPYFASVIRAVRFIVYFISILAPAIYVALSVFHQELIPTQLLMSMITGREQVPFPAYIEAFIMIFTFDVLREAGVRMPRPVGSTISIVGALVIGQSAVSAGLVSPIMVIVVAGTAISSFVISSQTDSVSILRYIYLALAGFAGGFGIIMGFLISILYLASLKSFGIPYLYPIAPFSLSGMQDTFIRIPWPRLKKRGHERI